MFSFFGQRNRSSAYILVVTSAGLLWSCGQLRADEKTTKVQALLRERVATLEELAAYFEKLYKAGEVPIAVLLKAKQDVVEAELDLCETNAERIKVQEKLLALAQQTEDYFKQGTKIGAAQASDVLKARADRLKIEIALQRLKAQ